jgi:hypothetical protein
VRIEKTPAKIGATTGRKFFTRKPCSLQEKA